MVNINYDKTHFFVPITPVDKVLFISNKLSAITPAAEPVIPKAFNDTFTHNGGSEVIVSGMFSINGLDFYPFGAYALGAVEFGNYEFVTVDGYMSSPGNIAIRGITSFFDQKTVSIYFYLEGIS